ncbi:slr1658 superfamily regulator [Nannocystis pusilla]|uniref:slr1658 superfamily regulator n=1 Tax=Nannocystis pusilla TaxID=889268 RepID=UPI003DA5D787
MLTFYPGAFPVKWNQCSVAADFFAEYFVDVGEGGLTEEAERRDFVGSVGYVLNELIENAVKFCAGGTVVIDAGVEAGEFVVVVSNQVCGDAVDGLRLKFAELLDGDPAELLMQRVEDNAANPDLTTSGLGFLTMLSDYKARLGWRFDPAPGNPDNALLKTAARLQVKSS